MWKCPKCGREFKKKEQSHYCGEKPKTIEEYILRQDEEKQEDLRYIHAVLRRALPEAEERISWSMPTYWKNHNLVQFAASKNHIGFYPGSEAVAQFTEELQGYKTNKGTIQIPYGRVDAALIEKIAKWCWEREQIISEFNALGIKGLVVQELNLLKGDFVNLEYTLSNGQKVKLLEDDKVYLGNQIEIPGSERCYGIVADETYLLVCAYGCNGAEPEIVLYKKRW